MTQVYYVETPSQPTSALKGPYTVGDRPNIDGVVMLVTDQPPFYGIVQDPHPDPGNPDYTQRAEWVLAEKLVRMRWDSTPATPEQAASEKNVEVDARLRSAIRDGIPIDANAGTVVKLAYADQDERVWGLWGAGMTAPPNGFLVRLVEPYNGKTELRIMGAAKLDLGKQVILNHVTTSTVAWDDARDDVQAILDDGGLTDQQKVDAIRAIDVESYSWPSNDVPA